MNHCVHFFFFWNFHPSKFGESALRSCTITQTLRWKTTTTSMNEWNTLESGITWWWDRWWPWLPWHASHCWDAPETCSLRPQISLEHSFHLLLHGHIEDAKRQLSITESWRYGKESAAQYQSSKLIQAYRSLLDYIIWCDKKFTHSNTGKMMHTVTALMFVMYLLVFLTQAVIWYHSAIYRSKIETAYSIK